MSLTNLNNTQFPLTLDGLQIIDADAIYINGEEIKAGDYVPYTGANKNIDIGTYSISTVSNPVADNNLTRKGYIVANYYDKKESEDLFVNISGDTMIGPLVLNYSNKQSTLTNNAIYLGGTQNGRRYLIESNESEQLTIQKQNSSTGYYETKFYINAEGRTVVNSDRLFIGQANYLTDTVLGYLMNLTSDAQTQFNNRYTKTESDTLFIPKDGINQRLRDTLQLFTSTSGDMNYGFILRANAADGADFNTTNGDLITWQGLGIVDKTTLTRTIYFDARNGTMGIKGSINFDGNSLTKTIVGYLSDLTSSPQQQINSLSNNLANNYYTKTYINTNYFTQLYITTNYYDITSINNKFADYYTSAQIDTILTNYYTSTQIDTNFYTKTQIDTTLTNYYTAAQTDAKYGQLAASNTWTADNLFNTAHFRSTTGPIVKITKNTAPNYLFFPQLRFDGGYDNLNRGFFKIDCITEYKTNPFTDAMLILNSQYESPVGINSCSYNGRFCIDHEQWNADKSKILLYDLNTVANPYSIGLSPGWLCLNSPDKIAMCINGINTTANAKLWVDTNGINGQYMRLADNGSLWVGPTDAGSFRIHHTGTNSYLDYGTGALTIRRNDGSNNITQAAYVDTNGKWIYAPTGSGLGIDRINIVGGISLQNISPYDGSNKLTFVHNYGSGWAECQQYTFLNGSQGGMAWRWSPSGGTPSSYENIFMLLDDTGGNREAVLRAKTYIQKSDFELLYLNRVGGGDLFGACVNYQISGIDMFRQYGGRIDSTQGYWAMDLRYNSAMSGGSFYYDSLIYSTYGQTTFKQNLTITKDFTINNTGEATIYMKANNFGASSWAIQTNGGDNYLYFWRYENGINWTQEAAIKDNGDYYKISDERFKKDIKDLKTDKSLQKVLNSRCVSYLMKSDDDNKQERNIGLLAQQQQEINEYCVKEMHGKIVDKQTKYKTIIDDEGKELKVEYEEEKIVEDKKLMINYNDYVIHLIGGMQEQQKQINTLHEKIQSLEEIIKQQNDTLISIINFINKK